MIVYKDKLGGKSAKFDLHVEVLGLKIVIGAGPLREKGVDLRLYNSQEHTIAPDDTDPLQVDFWIVQHKTTDEVAVLIDELLPGDPAYDFESSDYRPIHPYVGTVVPAGSTSLDDVDVFVTRYLEALEE